MFFKSEFFSRKFIPGSLKILSGGAQSIECLKAGAVELAHNGNKKIETTQTGAVITGVLTATTFSGNLVGGGSGISTFYDLRVTNNLTVEGTTTTLDTNLIGVDRVEVGANSNTVTGIAVTQSGTADIVRLYDGSTQVVTVTDTGDVGIGDDAPNSSYGTNLSIHSTGNNTGARIKLSDGTSGKGNVDGLDLLSINGTAFLYNRENNNLLLGTDNTTRIFIKNTGEVGINTSDASNQLTVFAKSGSSVIARFKEFNESLMDVALTDFSVLSSIKVPPLKSIP